MTTTKAEEVHNPRGGYAETRANSPNKILLQHNSRTIKGKILGFSTKHFALLHFQGANGVEPLATSLTGTDRRAICNDVKTEESPWQSLQLQVYD